MDGEEITARLLDTLRDEHGAGSDLDVGTYGDPWLEVNGNLDIEHLTSDIEQIIVGATFELQKRIDRLSHTVRKLSGDAAWDISELIDEGLLEEGDLS